MIGMRQYCKTLCSMMSFGRKIHHIDDKTHRLALENADGR